MENRKPPDAVTLLVILCGIVLGVSLLESAFD
jgi:hypothetical protein